MGNKAVIVAHDTNFQNRDKRIGIYLHWCGSEDSVKEFLELAKERGIRGVDSDNQYFWARFAQVIGDEFSKHGDNECSLGIGIVKFLDCRNYDNGVYYINDNFEITKHTEGDELEENEDDIDVLSKEEYCKKYNINSEEWAVIKRARSL